MPPLSLRERFLRTYARLSDPPIRWLTSAGAETPEGAQNPNADFSIAGRGALAAELDNPTSLTSLGLGLMGMLAGPFGIAVGAGKSAITAHNASALQAALAGVGRGQQLLGQVAQRQPAPLTFDPAEAGVPGSPDAGISQGATPADSPGPGDNPDTFRTGGLVRDRMTRPGGEEVIRAHEGEFVVRRGAVKKYRRLLAAINAGRPPDAVAQLADAMTE